ncbi:cytochrome d ubiquinol oxidase subunit II [Paenalcaligenes hominis]|uniref:Cytochrome d ubiquinol oxidase subunit II n=1 Tax=Paenalcaligenes hominis TaxID=643674 RepID=A0ABX0WQR8_9BURK|nr:cytochrome d ubiquinol oxidase subunit II [Paenalcaligenes hominis]NJB64995.1 cytochrome d ubiquinol oxidase subunit II [Paenalcaligenes hominis]GGE57542.1 cytochrome D ubiquinol oxidase subunit II [Paenalcaligenes hominis]
MESLILLDYVTMRHIWWLLLGVLLVGFAIMDGADLGIAMLLPLVAKTDAERRVLYNVIGPVWEGNQVWLIVAGGVVFAAWPLLYALSFSGFYLAMMLLLVALIVRPVAIKYRSKIESVAWRRNWDAIWCASGVVSALVFGVAVGNVMLGVPFYFESDTLRPIYEGSFFALFQPFALLSGVLSILLMLMQGGVVLSWKTEGEVARLATRWARYAGLAAIAVFVLGGVWIASSVTGYSLNTGIIDGNAVSNPLLTVKEVTLQSGGWMQNYKLAPATWIAPVVGIVGALGAIALVGGGRLLAVIMSSLSIAGVIFTFGFSTYPFLLPSSTQPASSLTLFDASASHWTLWVMLLVTMVFLPLIIAYTSWVYRIMRGKVTPESVETAPHSY